MTRLPALFDALHRMPVKARISSTRMAACSLSAGRRAAAPGNASAER